MKNITDYFVCPNNKTNKVSHSLSLTDESLTSSQPDNDSPDVLYETRKIIIRLGDPTSKEPYVCEVYDTSLEEDSPSNQESSNKTSSYCAFNMMMTASKKNIKSKKRGRQKKSCANDSESSDDEALIIVKKKLKSSTSTSKDKEISRSGKDHRGNATQQNLDFVKCSGEGDSPKISRKDVTIIKAGAATEGTLQAASLVKNAPFKISKRSKCKVDDQMLTLGKSDENASGTSQNKKELNVEESKGKRLRNSKVGIKKYFSSPDKNEEKKSLKLSSPALKKEPPDSLLQNECCVVLEKIVAPLFLKNASKKPTVNPDVLKARQAFLQKGLPATVLKNKRKQTAIYIDPPFFPPISHVQQSCDNVYWQKRTVNLNLIRTNFNFELLPLPCWKPWSIDQSLKKCPIGNGQIKCVKNPEKYLRNLITTYPNVKIQSLYDSLKYTKNLQDQNNEIEPVWTEKYKLKSYEFLTNQQSIAKLEKWLISWKRFGENMNQISSNEHNSSDDFVSSDDETEKCHAPITTCLLEGPTSSGKTSLVQALAAELDFHILEVNCSSKRSGKKMLADLQEATKSHKILQEANGNVGTSSQGEKMAMIVVEEADIIFEDQDDGFLSGLLTLVNSARRPVLLLTSDSSVHHLEKFRTSQTMHVKLVRPQITASCAFMELVALVQGVVIPRAALLKMLSCNKGDLRQSLLVLQFWLQHGSVASNSLKLNFQRRLKIDSVWWTSHKLLFGRDIWHSQDLPLKKTEEKMVEINESLIDSKENEKETMTAISKIDFFDSLSLCDVLEGNAISNNLEISNFEYKIKDSSYLGENLELENYSQKLIKDEIIEEILQKTIVCAKSDMSNNFIFSIPSKEKRWLSSQRQATAELDQVLPHRHSHLARHCDYLPYLRQICRAENKRIVENTKRRNRFHHYLKTMGGSPTEANLAINCSVLFS